ncbi:MAG TPA: kelch repeat-containing protein [Humisphaera sp.]
MLDLDNPNAGWQERARVPEAGDHTSVEVIDGKVYVVGGEHGHAAKLPEDDAPYVQHDYTYRYDPATDAWEKLADMPQGRSHAEGTSFQANGKIVVMGGKLNATDVSDRIDVYDPATNTWTTSLTPLPKPWQGGAAIYANGNVYLSHGQTGAPDHSMWRGTWVGSLFGV